MADCTYCGQPADTVDHVPPYSFFPPPRPSDLITVPSCSACNGGFQKDDDYIRSVLLMRAEVAEHPRTVPLLDAMLRAIDRPQGAGLTALLALSLRDVTVASPDGGPPVALPAYVPDEARIRRFLERMVKGLHFHEQGESLPDGVTISVATRFEGDADLQQMVARYLAGGKRRDIGGNDFTYIRVATTEGGHSGIWILVFYGVFVFMVVVADHPSPTRDAA